MPSLFPDFDLKEVAILGTPKQFFRTSRKTLFFCWLMTIVTFGIGFAALMFWLSLGPRIWIKDFLSTAVLLAVVLSAFWGARALLRKKSRLQSIVVVVCERGICYCNDNGAITCTWDQIADLNVNARHQFEIIHGMKSYSHTSHQITLQRMDGVQMTFTDELDDITGLANAIRQELDAHITGDQQD